MPAVSPARERLVHYSAEPVIELHGEWHPTGHLKPAGFWFSVDGNDDGWADWCQAEEWGLDRLTYRHEVVLANDARVLRLSSARDIHAFDARYSVPAYPEYPELGGRGINWAKVATEAVDEPGGYQGIIIAPYIWECRFDPHWYYGWDCASGVVWDVAAVKEIRRITPS